MQGIGFGDLSVKALGFWGYGNVTVLAFRGFRTVECYRLGFRVYGFRVLLFRIILPIVKRKNRSSRPCSSPVHLLDPPYCTELYRGL